MIVRKAQLWRAAGEVTTLVLPVTAVSIAAIASVVQLDLWATEPLFAAVNLAVSTVMVVAGVYLLLREGQPISGWAFVAAGLSWLVIPVDVHPGWWAFLSWTTSGMFYVFVGTAILGYQSRGLRGPHLAWIVAAALGFTGTNAIAAVYTGPSELGYRSDAAWLPIVDNEVWKSVTLALSLGAWLALGIWFVMLQRARLRRASPLHAAALRPFMLFGAILAIVAGAVLGLASLLPDVLHPHGANTVVGLFVLALMSGLSTTMIRSRLTQAHLIAGLPEVHTPENVTAYLREALQDPTLEILYADPTTGSMLNAAGTRVTVDTGGLSERYSRWILDDTHSPVALVTGDPRLVEQPDVLAVAERIAGVLVENAQLQAVLRMRVAQLTASRTAERRAREQAMRAFKRDLHDGVQQTIAAARMDVDGLMDDLDHGQVPSTASLRALTIKLDVALGQVRGLAQGRQAPELAGGIERAVADTARELRLDADVEIADVDLGDLATPVYLIAREALMNVHKHANAEKVSVQVTADGRHVFVSIRDDGIGGANPAGNGMSGMQARAEELGGTFRVMSSPKSGTAIEVLLPCAS